VEVEHHERRLKRDGKWIDPSAASGNLLRGGSDRWTGRGLFQPPPVCVGGERHTGGKRAGLPEIAGNIQAALLGRAVGYSVRASHKGCLEAAVPLRSSLFPRAGAGVVHDLPADERRGVFRASAGAEVHALPAAGKSAVRDNHRSGRKGDYWEEAVSTVMLFNDSGSNPEL
jgi:hypothetical protein